MRLKNLVEVTAYLRTVDRDATDAVKWRTVTTATRAVMRGAGMPDVGKWIVKPLPPQAYSRYGDCTWSERMIRYRKQHVTEWWVTDLAHTIIHEAAHAITGWEMGRQGKRGNGGHGVMWRGVMATLEYGGSRAHNLPTYGSSRDDDMDDLAASE